ncbi:MAG TPA: hypothetical protein VEW25_13515 [Allosphingosinicella sp.]|nr:hypothetical protein [Allosphingosinicella sp.]
MFDLPPPDPGFEITIASRGISKGLAQTEGPQLLVRPELAFGRAYVGAYAKNVTSTSSDGEAGPVIGIRPQSSGFDLSLSATLKLALSPVGDTDDEALELAASVSRSIGALTPRLGITWSPDDLGSTGRSTFVEGGATLRLAANTNAGAAFARRERDGGPDYGAFNAGVSHKLGGRLTLDLRYYDTDRSGLGEPFRARVIGSVRARF